MDFSKKFKIFSATILVTIVLFSVIFANIVNAYNTNNTLEDNNIISNSNKDIEKRDNETDYNVNKQDLKNDEQTAYNIKDSEKSMTDSTINIDNNTKDNILNDDNNSKVLNSEVIQEGIYEITSAINGRQAFDVTDGLKNDGVPIQLWQQDDFQQQRFELIYEKEGYYTIKALISNKVLAIEGDNLVQTTKTGKDTEKWIIEEKGNNQYSVKSKYNGKYINVKDGDVKNGVKLNIEEKQESNTQKFNFNDKTIRGTKTIEDGIYTISSGLDNDKLFDVTDGKKEEGTPIQIWQRDGFEQQLFEIEYKGEGYYTIKSKLSNKVLAIKDEEVKNGTQIIQTEEKGEDREKWIIKNEGNNEYSIISKIGNYYIDVPGADTRNGVKMQVYQGNNNKAQRYKFTNREPMVGTKAVEEGKYTIASKIDANKMFDITSGSRENGAEVQLWQEDWFIQQEYELKYNEDGYYTIYARVSGKVLSVENKNVMDGTKIVQKTSTGADEEKWIIKNNGDGTYSIISKINNYYIDVPGADAKNGTKLNMHDGNGTNAQKFILSRIVPEKGSQTVEDSTYRIISPIDDKKAFDIVDGKSEAGTKVQIWNNDGFTQQKFSIEYIGEGYYKIRSKLSNKVLTVESEMPEYNSEITQEEDKNLDTQKWIIKDLGNGLYNIISKCENLYLTIESNPKNGQRVKLDRKNNTNRQQFILINETPKQGISTGIADEIYQLKLKNGMVLDVNGASYENYGNIQIWSNDYAQQKKFRITRIEGTDYYKITAIHSIKAIDVENGGIDIGTNIGQYEQNGTDNQYWYLKDLGNGYYNIISKANGLCLDIAGGMTTKNGTNVQLYYSNNSDAQQFKLENVNIINADTYQIQSTINENMVFDISGGAQYNYANLQLWEWDDVDQQNFILQPLSNDEYTIIAKHSNKAVDVENGGTTPGTNVGQYEQNGTDNQKWIIKEAGYNEYYIISKANGLYLDNQDSNAQNGGNIQLFTYNNTKAQRFKFVHKPDKDITIVLNAGHGGSDPGCVNGWIAEENVTLQIARYIRDELSRFPRVTVILTRDGDYNMSLEDRAMVARNNNADLYVSLHINDEGSHISTGSQMYIPFYEGQRKYNSSMYYLSTLFQQQLEYLGIRRNIWGGIVKRNIDRLPKYQYLLNGQVVQADYYADIRFAMKGATLGYGPDLNTETGVPTILVEHCFMNSSDSQFLDSDADLRNIARADANALIAYFGL